MRRISDSRWVWVIALAFVLLTLAALVAIPVFVQRRVDASRDRIQASEPARTLLRALQFNIVRELASLREYESTRDPNFVATFNAARAAEQRTFRELEPLVQQLGPDAIEHFVHARTLAEQWHDRMADRELVERVLLSLEALDATILQTTERTRAEIERSERVGLQLTLLSGLLATVAAAAVGALLWRVRRLAAESERRRLEVVTALAESARAAEARNRLLRGITHDVKNPLGAAKGYAELLELGVKGELTEEQRAMVKGVERSLDTALAIISDLLDLARTDSGGITVNRVSTDLSEVARQAVEDHRAAAEAAGHNIAFVDPPKPIHVYTDPARIRQVLDNLLSNAIKYTPAPGTIVVRTEADASDAPRVGRAAAIRVTDTGPGIPPDKREHVFDEFTRLDDGGALKGHGLGLAIARRIARLLGGELGVTDGPPPGATFVLWLPQREAQIS